MTRRKKSVKLFTRNKFEERIDASLRDAGLDYSYESEALAYTLPPRRYIPDFVINGTLGKIYIECKGHFRPEHKAKMKAVKKLHPTLDLRIIFYRTSKQNERWAIKNGFPYAISSIPEAWLEEMR